MNPWSWQAARYGALRGHAKYQPGRRDEQLCSVYNPRTQQYEEIPRPQLQQLLRDGLIEEHETQSPYDGLTQRVYRLV
jgi:hypothetical protein